MTYYVVDVRHVCGLSHLPYVDVRFITKDKKRATRCYVWLEKMLKRYKKLRSDYTLMKHPFKLINAWEYFVEPHYVGNEKCKVFLTSIKESELNNILFGKLKRRLNIKTDAYYNEYYPLGLINKITQPYIKQNIDADEIINKAMIKLNINTENKDLFIAKGDHI